MQVTADSAVMRRNNICLPCRAHGQPGYRRHACQAGQRDQAQGHWQAHPGPEGNRLGRCGQFHQQACTVHLHSHNHRCKPLSASLALILSAFRFAVKVLALHRPVTMSISLVILKADSINMKLAHRDLAAVIAAMLCSPLISKRALMCTTSCNWMLPVSAHTSTAE